MQNYNNEERDKEKKKEIAATNRLLNVIRGEDKIKDIDENPSAQKANHKEQIEYTQGRKNLRPLDNKEKGGSGPVLNKTSPVLAKNQSFASQMPRSFGKQPKRPAGWLKWLKGKEKRAIGLDIGSHSVKFIHIEKDGNNLRVINYKIVELPSVQKDDEGTAYSKILKSMLLGINLESTRLVTSLSGPSVIVRHVQFPPMSEKELAKSLSWEAKSYIPFPINEVDVDYQILPRKKNEQKLDVILVAVTKKTLRSHLEILENASIMPDIIDIDPLVLINTYMVTNYDEQEKTVALIYIGAKSSVLSIYRQGSLFFTRDIHIGGNAFTKQIQSQWKVTYEEAESIKKSSISHENTSPKDQDLQKLFKPVLSDLISEVRRSLIYYDNQTGKKGFGNIILTGGGSLLNGLSDIFSSELGLPLSFLEPFKRLRVNEGMFSPLLRREHGERLSLAVGLALRGTL